MSCRNMLQINFFLSAKKYITVLGKVNMEGSFKPGVLVQSFQFLRPEAPENSVLLRMLMIGSVNT